MKKLERSKFDEIEKIIFNAISNTEFHNHVYMVGGSVRDSILNRQTNDIDLVVDLPNGGIRLAEYLYATGTSSQPIIFKNFGTAMIKIKHQDIELVMTRKEFYSNNSRKPSVEVGSIYDDAIRRDFTINALYRKINESEVLDLTGKGIADLENKLLRTTNNPDLVFVEDPLRMLRAIRFSTQLDFTIEENCWKSIQNNYSKLANISVERVRDELSKIIIEPNFSKGLKLLLKSNLTSMTIPHLDIYPETFWENLDTISSEIPNILEFRLALILCKDQSTKEISHLLKKIKFSTKNIQQTIYFVDHHRAFIQKPIDEYSDSQLRYWIIFFGEKLDTNLRFSEIISLLHNLPFKADFPQIRTKISETYLPLNSFPVDGHSIKIVFPHITGKKIGHMLDQAYQIWLENPDWSETQIIEDLQILQAWLIKD